MTINVVKRNGDKVPFDVQKIRKQIEFATQGTKLNPLELESKVSAGLKNNIKTAEIQELLIHTVTTMVNQDEPEWILVAGRLATHQLHREVYKNTKFDYNQFDKYVNYAINNKYYRKDLADNYTGEDLEELRALIEVTNNKNTDFNRVLPQVLSLKSKYLLRNQRGTIEYPMFSDMASSMVLASIEKNPVKISKEYFEALNNEYISLATPFKANLRIEGGNTGSCFILPTGDSLEHIAKTWRDAGKISKEGGGIGLYLGDIRPGGSYSRNIPRANNVTKWVKIINDIAVAVNQRGIRPGAITPAVDWWHLDVEDFIEVKTETGGDLREKSFDIFPQIVVDKYFIDKKKNNEDVYLFDHFEYKNLTGKNITSLIEDELYEAHLEVEELIKQGKLKNYKKINSKHLWSEFLRVWIEIGDFYIVHKDNINFSNYLKGEYIANSANLCTESWSINKTPTEWSQEFKNDELVTTHTDGLYHSCNLLSINVGAIFNDKLLEKTCRTAVRMLDASIDKGTMPVKEAENSAEWLRNVGIGTVGVADWMAWNKFTYEKDLDELEKLQEKIAFYCYNASIDLAIEKGSYPGIKTSDYSTLFGRDPKELTKESLNGFDWVSVQKRIKTYGIRNFLLLCTAPNTSSGIVMNATASYLPPQNKMNYQTLADINTPIVPRYLKERYWYYKPKYTYAAHDLIKATRRLQKWIDTGISMEVYINPELTNIKKISDEILDGFDKKELKCVYYSLTIDAKRDGGCIDCAN